MSRSSARKPTDAELSILQVLWEHGPSSVRQVHDVLSRDRSFAYTTTLKFLQIMTDKGLVLREDQGRHHLYRARQPRKNTQRRLLRELIDRAFGGSISGLVVQALSAKRATPAELREIRRLLSSLKEKDHE
jgi:predicted transcriptional regulator